MSDSAVRFSYEEPLTVASHSPYCFSVELHGTDPSIELGADFRGF